MEFKIKLIENHDVQDVLHLVRTVFDQFEAPDYSSEGVAEFYKYIQVDAMASRISKNHFGLLALKNSDILGMIEIRDFEHISLLFVDSDFQGQGIGKKLWIETCKKCIKSKGEVGSFTVNSSPFAVPIYEKLGFRKVSEEQSINGIRFYPMLLRDSTMVSFE